MDRDIETAMLRRDVEELSAKVDKLSHDVESLLAAWQTSMHVVGMVKWLAGVGAAVAAIWMAIKGFGK